MLAGGLWRSGSWGWRPSLTRSRPQDPECRRPPTTDAGPIPPSAGVTRPRLPNAAKVTQLEQRAQDSEIARMPELVVPERRLENHRRVAEARLGEQASERFDSEAALAQVGMAILA